MLLLEPTRFLPLEPVLPALPLLVQGPLLASVPVLLPLVRLAF
jgi:hypothetical protein